MSDEQRQSYCGCPDHLDMDALTSRWPSTTVTWTLLQGVPGIPDADLLATCARAMGAWASVCGVKPVYTETGRTANILVTSEAIDGPMGVLGQTELPMGQAQVHLWLDTAEPWTEQEPPGRNGISLYDVVLHEAGHAFGLGHAPQGSPNIMAPIYNPAITSPQSWEINQMVARYGQHVAAPAPTPTPQPIPKPPGGSFMNRDALLKMLNTALSLFEMYARATPSTTDDAVASAMRMVLDLLTRLLTPGQNVSAQEVETVLGAVKTHLVALT